jgi:hypothetical protein
MNREIWGVIYTFLELFGSECLRRKEETKFPCIDFSNDPLPGINEFTYEYSI